MVGEEQAQRLYCIILYGISHPCGDVRPFRFMSLQPLLGLIAAFHRAQLHSGTIYWNIGFKSYDSPKKRCCTSFFSLREHKL